MIRHLHNLKDKTITEINDVYEAHHANMLRAFQTLNEILFQTFKNKKDIIESISSNFQIFLGIKEAEERFNNTKDIIQNLFEICMSFNVNSEVDSNIRRIENLGEIKVSKQNVSIPVDILLNRCNEAVVSVLRESVTRLEFKKQFILTPGLYNGCYTLPCGLIVVTNLKHDKKELVILNADGSSRECIDFRREGLLDVVDDESVAVSNQNKNASLL